MHLVHKQDTGHELSYALVDVPEGGGVRAQGSGRCMLGTAAHISPLLSYMSPTLQTYLLTTLLISPRSLSVISVFFGFIICPITLMMSWPPCRGRGGRGIRV